MGERIRKEAIQHTLDGIEKGILGMTREGYGKNSQHRDYVAVIPQ